MSAHGAIVGVIAHAQQGVFDAVLAAWSRGECVAMFSPQDAQSSARRVESQTRAPLPLLEPVRATCRVTEFPEAASCLFATSGSTGDAPKLARISARALLANARSANARIPFGATDNWLVPLSLHHVGGFGAFLRAHIAGGRVAAAQDKPLDIADALCADASITHCSLVPTQLYRLLARFDSDEPAAQRELLRERLCSLKALLMGGAPSANALRSRAMQLGVPLHVTYGMTECASQAATARAELHRAATDAGAAIDGTQITIASTGEIILQGATLFDGYLGEPPVEGSAFATGDRGGIDSEGRLHVEGRIHLAFKSGGEFVQPEHVERAILELEGVSNAVVVPIEDAEWGNICVAFVEGTRTITRDALRGSLAPHELPRQFLAWPDASLSGGIKPSREKMRMLAAARQGR
ncbi:MAG: hypothetical protein EXS10_00550 [Phycisphaerales bacterium]|nr:hypothetical protein [Phycisphaerales bacterium]